MGSPAYISTHGQGCISAECRPEVISVHPDDHLPWLKLNCSEQHFFLDQVNKLTDVRSKDLSHTFNHLPRLLKIYLINPFSLICLSFLYPPTNLSSLFQLYFIQLLSEFFVNMWWLLSCVVLHWWYLNFRNSTYDNRKTLTMQLWADWDSTFYRVYSEF